MKTYYVFVRDWWRIDHLGRKVPAIGGRTEIATGLSYKAARDMCQEYNDTHDPGALSRKAEFAEE